MPSASKQDGGSIFAYDNLLKKNMMILKRARFLVSLIAELPSGAPLASWEIKGNP